MRSTERPEFLKLISQLCAGHNQPMTDDRSAAYWRGLSNMPLVTFERVVDYALGEHGPERLPTAPQLWSLYRSLQAQARVREAAPAQGSLVVPHVFTTHANQVLLEFLRGNHRPYGRAASPASLAAMLAVKNRLVDAYRIICEDEPAACSELRDKLIEAFQQAFVPAREGDYSYPIRCVS